MRVLMVIRPDARDALGGDTIQMERTAAELRRLGLSVEECVGPAPPESITAVDWVHLFNLQTPEFTLAEALKAEVAGKPIAVSTIFWDFGAEQLLAESPLWGRFARFVGRSLALRFAQRRVDSVARPGRDMIREILRRATLLLPNSRAEVCHLRRMTRFSGRIVVVPNAVDPVVHHPGRGLPRPNEVSGTDNYVLIAARIEPHKNQLAYCRALAGTGMPVVLAGSAPDPPYLEACLREGAHYLGSLSGDRLHAAMAHARVHALPSYRETPGLASLEAAAMGCAIVTTEFGCAREYFGGMAHYCRPTSPESMRKATESAWREGPNPELSERIRREFTWARAAQRTLAAYRGET